MPSVYHVSAHQCTDVEPSAGWYVGPLHDDDHPHGPFYDRERAEEWRAEHANEVTP